MTNDYFIVIYIHISSKIKEKKTEEWKFLISIGVKILFCLVCKQNKYFLKVN